MATELTAQLPTLASDGLTPTYAAADAAGNYFTNDGKTILHAKNTNAATRIITFVTPYIVGGVAVSDPTATIPATTGDKLLGPFDPTVFNDSNGRVQMTFSAATNLTLAVVRIP